MEPWLLDISIVSSGGSENCFLVEVPHRRTKTLKRAIVRYIQPGRHIVSNGWVAHAGVEDINQVIYSHDVVTYQ